ncbi:MAG: TRAP transporter large permease subunit, partial [Desulfobacterales bacterium]|nr:TRAP transporter large permease subunit [Desulfobacterales bacterium]
SLVLGMGLPVTASYIVLAVLAAPSMEILGASLIASHMLIFWYSQDANVTPPVCLAAYSAAGISGSRPLETGFESWKLAKGIYIIPLLFVYTPILFEGPLWQVLETAAAAMLGLFCAAVMFEGYHLMALNWGLRLAYLAVAGLMLWPLPWLHAAGAVIFVGLTVAQKMMARPAVEGETH